MSNNQTLGHRIELTEFSFPSSLEDDQANFRLQVDLRYRIPGAKGGFATKTVIMPGLHSYWECSIDENRKWNKPREQGKRYEGDKEPPKQKDRYKRICVRKPDTSKKKTSKKRTSRKRKDDDPRYFNQVDIDNVANWDKSFRVHAQELYELRVSVLDVNRQDWYDKVVDMVKGAVGVLTAVPVVGSALEPLIDGAASSVGSALVSKDDDVLFIGDAGHENCQYEIGEHGYRIVFSVKCIKERDNCVGSPE